MLNLPILIGVATWYLSQKATKLKEDAKALKLTPIGISTKDYKLYYLDLQITNPTSSKFTIDSLSANVYLNDALIGTVYRYSPFEISPTNNSIVQLSIQLKQARGGSIEIIAKALQTLLKNKAKYKQFRIIGAYKYLGITFPLNETLNLNASK